MLTSLHAGSIKHTNVATDVGAARAAGLTESNSRYLSWRDTWTLVTASGACATCSTSCHTWKRSQRGLRAAYLDTSHPAMTFAVVRASEITHRGVSSDATNRVEADRCADEHSLRPIASSTWLPLRNVRSVWFSAQQSPFSPMQGQNAVPIVINHSRFLVRIVQSGRRLDVSQAVEASIVS